MRDTSLLLREFDKFAGLVESQGRTPGEEDIEYFVSEMWLREYGFLYPEKGGVFIKSAQYHDKEADRPIYDVVGLNYSSFKSELIPLLTARVKETYGEVGTGIVDKSWNPEPIVESDLAARYAAEMGIKGDDWASIPGTSKRSHDAFLRASKDLIKVKNRIANYNEKVLPFVLRKTMHHPINTVLYFTSGEKPKLVRNITEKTPFVISSEEELQDYLASSTVDGFPAAKHGALRSIFWVPSVTGKDVKVGIIDLDNPAGLSKLAMRNAVRYAAEQLANNGHPYIIMFTGHNYQIWFGQNPTQPPLGDIGEVKHHIRALLYNPEMYEFNRKNAIDQQKVWVDENVYKTNQAIRMFFSLHYPTPDSKKAHTGLAAVPIALGDIEQFDPLAHAHPEYVLENFGRYSSLVSAFFDTVQVGQDYEMGGDIEAAPPCYRHESREKDHPLLSHLVESEDMHIVPSEDIEAMLGDEEKVTAFIKERGVPAVLHYNKAGGIKVGGKTLSMTSTKLQSATQKRVKFDTVKAVLITKDGIVIYDDYITRDIERYCEAANIKKLTLAGDVVKYDLVGNNEGAQAVRSTLGAKEGIDHNKVRMLKFVSTKLSVFGTSTKIIPMEKQLEELAKISTARIKPTMYYSIQAPVGEKVKRLFGDLLLQRKVGSLIVKGENTYTIVSRRTITAVVVGIDKLSKAYINDSSEIGPVFVAVAKNDGKYGQVYFLIGKAEIALKKEDRVRLKEMVRGENSRNIVPVGVRKDDFADMVEIADPSVVVEVQYDDVSPRMTPALVHRFTKDKRSARTLFRPLPARKWVTPLVGARITSIREDLSPRRVSDINIKQDPLIHTSGKRPKRGLSILSVLPNPNTTMDLTSDTKTQRFTGDLDFLLPWHGTPDLYEKLIRLGHRGDYAGLIIGNTMVYKERENDALVDTTSQQMISPFSFVTKQKPLDGVDVTNAINAFVAYGSPWHAVVYNNMINWIHVDFKDKKLAKLQEQLMDGKDSKHGDKLALAAIADSKAAQAQKLDKLKHFDISIMGVTGEAVVRSNPAFFGVPEYGYYHVGGIPGEPITYTDSEGREVTIPVQHGGSRRKVHLFKREKGLEGEFQKAYERGKKHTKESPIEGYKVYLDPYSSTTAGSDGPYYTSTSLSGYMQTAVDDVYGYGGPFGTSIVSMGGEISDWKPHADQLDQHHMKNTEQAMEDSKILAEQMGRVPGGFQGDDTTSEPRYRYSMEDADYFNAMSELNSHLKASLRVGDMSKEQIKQVLKSKGIKLNPAVKSDAWNRRVNEYSAEYEKWKDSDDPKEPWEVVSTTMFQTWELPLLEKERLLRSATNQYGLSQADYDKINSQFGEPMSGDILESVLSDLYEEDTEDGDEPGEE